MNLTYNSLKSKLKEAGIDCELFRLTNRWIALKVFSKSADHWFWVRFSQRGWFLGDRDVFHVPDSSSILEVCSAWATETESHSSLILSSGLKLRRSWIQDENASEERIWKSIGWHRLSDPECDLVFDAFEKQFAYPSNQFSPPAPSVTWDFCHLYDCEFGEFEILSEELNRACLAALRQCLKSEDLLVLDWNHCCYRLDATSTLETGSSEMWPISAFPGGDYRMFVATDFRLGIVADPSGEVCAFGGQMPQILTEELGKLRLLERIGQ